MTHTPGPTAGDLINQMAREGRELDQKMEAEGRKAWETHPNNTPERQRAKRIREAAPAMLEALREFDIVTCEDCEGTGAYGQSRPGDACDYCGGTGLTIRGGDPHAIRAVLATIEEGQPS